MPDQVELNSTIDTLTPRENGATGVTLHNQQPTQRKFFTHL